jgi:wyosine [tRNA(Phe)-imidazoG37] synthetase (radical SAM superfamily)
VLNRGPRFAEGVAVDSVTVLARHGLRSVILIGGGEPTLHPEFGEVVRTIKELGLQCAVVSHGGHIERIAAVAPLFIPGDWVRLSLDAGTEATWQALHRPRGRAPRGLDLICADAGGLRARNNAINLGFSFLVT